MYYHLNLSGCCTTTGTRIRTLDSPYLPACPNTTDTGLLLIFTGRSIIWQILWTATQNHILKWIFSTYEKCSAKCSDLDLTHPFSPATIYISFQEIRKQVLLTSLTMSSPSLMRQWRSNAATWTTRSRWLSVGKVPVVQEVAQPLEPRFVPRETAMETVTCLLTRNLRMDPNVGHQ